MSGHTIYDCMDLYRHFSFATPELKIEEKNLIDTASAVITASEPVFDEIFGMNKNLEIIRNAATTDLFDLEFNASEIPIVGYIGAIEDWFDDNLLLEVSKVMRDVEFHIYGNIGSEQIKLKLSSSKNVVLHGEISRSVVPSVLATFSVGIIPFKDVALVKSTNPVKCYEYLAAGLPVVSTPMKEVDDFGEQVLIASNLFDFVESLKVQLSKSRDAVEILRRRDLVKKETWNYRAVSFLNIARKLNVSRNNFIIVCKEINAQFLYKFSKLVSNSSDVSVLVEKDSYNDQILDAEKNSRYFSGIKPISIEDFMNKETNQKTVLIWPENIKMAEFVENFCVHRAENIGSGWLVIDKNTLNRINIDFNCIYNQRKFILAYRNTIS